VSKRRRSEAHDSSVFYHWVLKTQLGYTGILWGRSGLKQLTFPFSTKQEALDELVRLARSRFEVCESIPVRPHWLSVLKRQLERRESFNQRSLPLDFSGVSGFYERVYRKAAQIPFGHTLSYGELAKLAGSPRAARAVGQALSRNPFPILVPCHRVLSTVGALGGFTAPGGLKTKLFLLKEEGLF
jgi:methylated-DNA-[protein]-cysteine S-methyltransferase